jgi:hypothetical protein
MLEPSEWTGWMNYYENDMIDRYEQEEELREEYNDWTDWAKEEVELRIKRWWSVEKFRWDKYASFYDRVVEDIAWYHLERTKIYENGLVFDLKEWRKARSECSSLISNIEEI